MSIKSSKIPSYLLIILMPLIFWIFFGQWHSGPTISDESGYLSKAALLGGHAVDGASPYYGGYSLFLAPAFAFFNTTEVVWSAILVVNAFFCFGSFFLLNRLISIWNPNISEPDRFCALLVSTLYPEWIVMSGYAYATPAIVFVFLADTSPY